MCQNLLELIDHDQGGFWLVGKESADGGSDPVLTALRQIVHKPNPIRGWYRPRYLFCQCSEWIASRKKGDNSPVVDIREHFGRELGAETSSDQRRLSAAGSSDDCYEATICYSLR